MTTGRAIPDAEFIDVIHDFEDTAFRLEMQSGYAEPEEDALFAAFLHGLPVDPTAVPELREWYAQVTRHVQADRQIERVRIHDNPPTDYQRFERSLDRWNLAAGEVMRYMTRQYAHDIGLLPAAGFNDWWLLDSSRLLVMRFDETGRRVGNELITDPVAVAQARVWRDLAVHHSTRVDVPGVAA